MFYDQRHDPEAQEWCFRMMNDLNQWEKFTFIDTINAYNNIIEELQKEYEQTPASATNRTRTRTDRGRIQSEMKEAKRDLAKTMAEYEMFKKYKMRTAISK